ncbi:MAG: CHASE4 domain-containing protein [Chloroflexota bacterium]
MTLRKKTIAVVVLTSVVLVALLHGISWIIVLGGFDQLERDNAHRDVERALAILSKEVSDLDSTTSDWAHWDDTYGFIEDGNTDYIESNLVDGTFIALRLNLMLFVDPSGEVVFGKAFDLHDEEEMPTPESLQEHLAADALLVRHTDTESHVAGLLPLSEGPMLIASRPILTSEDQGPVRGALVMGRYLDDAEVQRLAEVVQLSLTVEPFQDSQVPSGFQVPHLTLSEEPPIVVQPLTAESIAGYALLRDIYGEPLLILRATMPRDIHQQGQRSMYYLVASLVAVALASGAAILVVLEKLVLSRLVKISTAVGRVGVTGDLSARITVAGTDELARLAGDVNVMVEALQQSQRALQDLAAKDYLTGLWNHREFQAILAAEVARAQRSGGSFSLLFLDIDNFKSVNSRFGHQTGDRVLTLVGKFLKESLRTSDIAARYGGDEFGIILPDTRSEQAYTVAAHLQEAFGRLCDREAELQRLVPPLGLSIGIASYPGDALEVQELVARANRAMFHAKSLGGSRSQSWGTMERESDTGT